MLLYLDAYVWRHAPLPGCLRVETCSSTGLTEEAGKRTYLYPHSKPGRLTPAVSESWTLYVFIVQPAQPLLPREVMDFVRFSSATAPPEHFSRQKLAPKL